MDLHYSNGVWAGCTKWEISEMQNVGHYKKSIHTDFLRWLDEI